MGGKIYVGGALYYSSAGRLCPVVAKFDSNLAQNWALQPATCGNRQVNADRSSFTSHSDTSSYAVDMMYADHLNDHVYGLMVPRDANGALVSAPGYKIFKTRGNGAESDASGGRTEDCDLRRINVIYVKPYDLASTPQSYYWRPLGISYYQRFDVTDPNAEFELTALYLTFAATD